MALTRRLSGGAGLRSRRPPPRQSPISYLLLWSTITPPLWSAFTPPLTPVFLHDVLWAFWLQPLNLSACSLHDGRIGDEHLASLIESPASQDFAIGYHASSSLYAPATSSRQLRQGALLQFFC